MKAQSLPAPSKNQFAQLFPVLGIWAPLLMSCAAQPPAIHADLRLNNESNELVIIEGAPFIHSPSTSPSSKPEVEAILQTFVDSYRTDAMALTVTFGIKIGDQWWHTKSKRAQEDVPVGKKYTFHDYGPNEVSLHQGKPQVPTWYFFMPDRSVLDNINENVWNAGTAAMRTTPKDEVALDIKPMKGFHETQEATAISYQVAEHFWKKDQVEITTFRQDQALPTHGANAVSLYMMKDKRIAWFSLLKDEAANNDPQLDNSQVPNLMIFTKGKGKAIFADQEMEVHEGMSVFIGPYVKHIIFNPNDEPLEGILVLFGDNIDFALGQSYLDFLENQYKFLGVNEKEHSRANN